MPKSVHLWSAIQYEIFMSHLNYNIVFQEYDV